MVEFGIGSGVSSELQGAQINVGSQWMNSALTSASIDMTAI